MLMVVVVWGEDGRAAVASWERRIIECELINERVFYRNLVIPVWRIESKFKTRPSAYVGR